LGGDGHDLARGGRPPPPRPRQGAAPGAPPEALPPGRLERSAAARGRDDDPAEPDHHDDDPGEGLVRLLMGRDPRFGQTALNALFSLGFAVLIWAAVGARLTDKQHFLVPFELRV